MNERNVCSFQWSYTLLLALCFLFVTAQGQQEVTFRQMNTHYASLYPGITAAQGLIIPDTGVEINVMHPPLASINSTNTSDNLCVFPEWLSNLNSSSTEALQNADSHPICLVVTGEEQECTLQTQAVNLQQIQDSVDDRVKCLVVYGNRPDIYEPDIMDYDLAIIYIPFLAGRDLINRMDDLSAASNFSAFFFDLSGDNVQWRFPFRVQPYGGTSNYGNNADNFFWFRIVLFTLLIVSPCLRAAYLWYAGGGRIHLRRNENGRVIGFQYVPPMPHWLSSGIIIRPIEPVSTVLTLEQFDSLPTIIYEQNGRKSESENGDINDANEPHMELPVSDGATCNIDNASSAMAPVAADLEQAREAQESQAIHGRITSASQTVPESAAPASTELPSSSRISLSSPSVAPATTMNSTYATTCTVCSICIDDFEAGETLTILPRCQHAFHRDCIHPWLTERQGCCPLCKTNVFEQQDVSEEADREETAHVAEQATARRSERTSQIDDY